MEKEITHDFDTQSLDREDLGLIRRPSCKLLSEKDDSTEQMLRKILRLAIPAILNNVVRMLMEVINLSMIGQLGNPAMVAGVGMGNMTINMIGLSVIIGFNSALDTLISQGAGAGKLELCGVFRNRGMFFVCILFIPISIILNYSYEILVAIGQHKDVSEFSQQYI